MKYIKKYEYYSNRLKYKIGDFVVIDGSKYFNKIYGDDNILCRIIDIEPQDKIPYLVLFSDNKDFFIYQEMIIRKMTDDEMNKYQMELAANKFNI